MEMSKLSPQANSHALLIHFGFRLVQRTMVFIPPMAVGAAHRVHARRLREPDPASAPCHTKPQAQRYERRKSAEQRSIGGQASSRHAAANRERKKEHQEERRHL